MIIPASTALPSNPDAILALATALEARDPYTAGHSDRVTTYAYMLGDRLGLDAAQMDLLRLAARLHDIGKISVEDRILRKAGRLLADEEDQMRKHPAIGAEMIERIATLPREIIPVIRHHHERWDGLGYPYGLRGRAIPLLARILAVADSFDAMTSDRPYRKGMTVQAAMEIIKAGRGTQWQPVIVDAFTRLARRR